MRSFPSRVLASAHEDVVTVEVDREHARALSSEDVADCCAETAGRAG
jgi:hypothetical protein